MAVVVCYAVRYGDIGWLWPDTYEYMRIHLAWHYAFLASGLMGLLALASSLAIKEKRLICVSITSLVLSAIFAKLTIFWTYLK